MRLGEEDPWMGLAAEVGGLTLEAVPLDHATEVLPMPGHDVSRELAEVGLHLPDQGRVHATGDAHVFWSGMDAALVLGAKVELDGALCVDQSDGYAALRLGGTAREVLARLCPLDLRDVCFPVGSAARSLLNHVPALLVRETDAAWLLLVPRSMAGTVQEEIVTAARGLAAR